jgi:phosphatidylglycerol---prolipoprotein diacylglyceryl transferase
MYPNLYYAVKDWFGIEVNAFKIFYSFGIFVAISFIVGAILLTQELKRKEKQGKLHPEEEEITVGGKLTLSDIITNLLIGFVFGYKLVGAFIASRSTGIDLQEYIFSSQGSIMGGLLLAAVLVYLKYREKSKLKIDKPEKRIVRIWPHDRVGDFVVVALISGILGAKLFDNFENWDRFISNPLGNLLSPSGLTFYGGLICGSLAVCLYARKKHIRLWHLVDAAAPALMMAYALGRIGCQVAGDGDWGILNSAYINDNTSHAVPAAPGQFAARLQQDSTYYLTGKVKNADSSSIIVTDRVYPGLANVPHKSFKGPSFLPTWFYAYSYGHNVNEDGVLMPDCEGKYCRALPLPVFPTPFYETVAGLLLFGLLWSVRKRIKVPGVMFGVYLILNGLERFFIEQIRVNTTYSMFGLHPTQAELIAIGIVVTGIGIIVYCRKKFSSTHY